MTLILFQCHRYVGIIDCKKEIKILVYRSLICMVATHMKNIKHSMFSVTGVYLRDTSNTIFVIFHLNVSHLSVCCSCFCHLVRLLKRDDGKDKKLYF